MKTLFCLIASALLLVGNLGATAIQLTGTATWDYVDPNCTFNLNGSISNPTNTTTGTIKMVLWISAAAFPYAGTPVSEYVLTSIDVGGQIGSFTGSAPGTIPKITGDYYFTILIMEYTAQGWQTRTYVNTGKRHLENGVLASNSVWTIPAKPVINPPSALGTGDRLVLQFKATADLSAVPTIYQVKTFVDVAASNMAAVTIMGKNTPATRTYSVITDSLNGKSVKAGKLFLDYKKAAGSGPASNSTITLYFQSGGSGVYKHVSVNPSRGGTTWGTFTYR